MSKEKKQPTETKKNNNDKPVTVNEKMEVYVNCYPNNKVFYITSDGQVFLETNKNDAQNHQNYLDKSKELEVFEAK